MKVEKGEVSCDDADDEGTKEETFPLFPVVVGKLKAEKLKGSVDLGSVDP